MRLVKSGRWKPPVGTCGWGAWPHTNGVEVVDDPLTDILSKSIADPGGDPGGGGGIGSGAPPATNTGAVTGAAGFPIGCMMGAGAFTMLACTCGVTASIADGTGANRVAMGRGGKEYEGGETPNGIGAIIEGRGKFSCGGYGIGFIPWPNPGR